MKFIHKLVRMAAQGINVIHQAVHALHQLTDFGFITEGADGTNDAFIVQYRYGIAQQQTTVTANLSIFNSITTGEDVLQVGQQRGVLSFAKCSAVGGKEKFTRSLINQRYSPFIIHRNHPFTQRLQHGLALFKQAGNFMGLEAEKNIFQYPH